MWRRKRVNLLYITTIDNISDSVVYVISGTNVFVELFLHIINCYINKQKSTDIYIYIYEQIEVQGERISKERYNNVSYIILVCIT